MGAMFNGVPALRLNTVVTAAGARSGRCGRISPRAPRVKPLGGEKAPILKTWKVQRDGERKPIYLFELLCEEGDGQLVSFLHGKAKGEHPEFIRISHSSDVHLSKAGDFEVECGKHVRGEFVLLRGHQVRGVIKVADEGKVELSVIDGPVCVTRKVTLGDRGLLDDLRGKFAVPSGYNLVFVMGVDRTSRDDALLVREVGEDAFEIDVCCRLDPEIVFFVGVVCFVAKMGSK